jgi:hypothetical protein
VKSAQDRLDWILANADLRVSALRRSVALVVGHRRLEDGEHAVSPIVKNGKMIWKATVAPNWIRDNKSVTSMGVLSPISCDAFRMGEYLEPVVAGDAHKSEAGRLGSADRQSRRRGHPDYDGRPYHACFLHELDRDPAR